MLPSPPAIDTTAPRAGLSTIAVIEAAQGAVVLLVGLGLLSLPHRDATCRISAFNPLFDTA